MFPNPLFRRDAARVACLACAVLALAALSGCRDETPAVTSRFSAFGAQVDLSLVRVSAERAERAKVEIQDDFRFLERALDPWHNGPMMRVNRLLPTGEPFVAPPSMMPVLRLAKGYSERSGGLFNPAIGSLIELWGFNAPIPECQPPPSERAIQRLVAADPKLSDIHIQGLGLVGDNRALKLDFGAMVKGYAIDLAIERLRELGVRDARVQVGRTRRVIGDRSGQPWMLPVRRGSGSAVLGVLQVRGNGSLATVTAGDHTFIYGGMTYHDILDPRTGWPAADTLAVTVLHEDATTAEAAAHAIFIAGPEGWQEVARSMGVGFVLLEDSRGMLHMNPEMHERLDLMDLDIPIRLGEPLSGTDGPGGSGSEGSAGQR